MRVATFDTETNGLFPDVDRVWCAAVKDHDSGEIKTFTPDSIHLLPDYLGQYDVLVGQNTIGFDFKVLKKVFNWEYKGTKVDTLLMSRMQRPKRRAPKGSTAGPHSVESWGLRLGHSKVEHDEWDKYSPHMLQRCIEDVEIQYSMYQAILQEGKGEGWRNAHMLNHKLHHYLGVQEDYGWNVDRQLMDNSIACLLRWIGRIDDVVDPRMPLIVEINEGKKDGEVGYVRKPFKKNGELVQRILSYYETEDQGGSTRIGGPFSRICFRPVNLDKNVEVKDFLLDSGWKPAEWNYNNAGAKTSPKLSKDDPFDGVQGGLGKLIAKRVQCKQRLGIIEGWKENLRPDGRLTAGVSGTAATGRLRHKGIVNVPSPSKKTFFAKQMRNIFIASPGMVMVGVDSKGNQIRQLAARMNDPVFTQAVLTGTAEEANDHHSLTQKASGVPTREHAKNVFYALIFGAGDAKLGSIIGGRAAQGKELKARLMAGLPGLKRCIEELTVEWRDTAQKWYDKKLGRWTMHNGYITGIDGRPILVESEHAILNYALQSDEAIQMGVGYVMVHKRMEERGYELGKDWGMLIWMHDEYQMEARPEIVEEVGQIACDCIAWAGRYLKIHCPHEGSMKIGNNWTECH